MQNNEPLYDLSQLIAISRGNEVFVKKMVDIFCEQTPVLLTQMEEAFHTNDLERMGEIAHKMKPSIDNLNIIRLKQVIRDIEHTGKEKIVGADLNETFAQIRAMVTRIVDSLRKDYPVR
jgi:HPt (histidine-containing phosphotransfer) domain-containing protein